jgi:hypothetical protein
MQPETIDLVKQFEKKYSVRVETHESYEHPVFWEVMVWMTKTADYEKATGSPDLPRIWGRKYITTPTAGGQVFVIKNPQKSDMYTIESWGDLSSYDSFVKSVLDRVEETPLNEDFSTLCEECGGVIPSG